MGSGRTCESTTAPSHPENEQLSTINSQPSTLNQWHYGGEGAGAAVDLPGKQRKKPLDS
uniref:Uncharacterized protein n=1 Tax=Rubinisphaera brasiliensis (strain ATCC 49424 / DSM 5305 / JCM 21570 / IAM 15109 / NBRC 103401 / IFAM 1448) TaxID=756272 RepID=F0SSD5_RUBBR|nr:hypothetical protein Plabr_1595 [Rubinisphaera brasiliensis DSM 5305]